MTRQRHQPQRETRTLAQQLVGKYGPGPSGPPYRPLPTDMRMVLCPNCGNKRCPHANDHRNACTGSNEPGQPGSAYPAHGPSCTPIDESDDPEGGAPLGKPSRHPPFLPARYAELIANPGPTAPADGLSYGMRMGWALEVALRKAEVEAAAFPARSAASKKRARRGGKKVKP